MVPLLGAFIPLAPTAAIRLARDGRPAIDERYADRYDYVGRVTTHALELIDAGYLLAEDLAPIIEEALAMWRYTTDESD
jgi:hypothetical protein